MPKDPLNPDDDFEARAASFFDDQELFGDVNTKPKPEPKAEPVAGSGPEPERVPEATPPEPEPPAAVEPPVADDEDEAIPLPWDTSPPPPAPTAEPDPTPPAVTPPKKGEKRHKARSKQPVSIHDLPILDETPPAYSRSQWHDEQEIKRHRFRRAVIVGLTAYLVLAVVLMAYGVLRLRDARGHLSGTEAELSFSNLSEGELTSARSMESSLGKAHSALGSPVVYPFKLVPVFGRQLRALDGLAQSGERVIKVGIEARERALPVVKNPPKNGAERLEALETARDLAKDGNDELSKIDLGPANNLIGPIASTRTKFAGELNRIGEILQRTEAGAGGMATFLKGPSKYAVFAANNSEMRAGSGMYLSAGTLEVNNGELKLGPMQSISALPPAPNNVALEYDYLRLWGLQAPGSDYRFVNMTPRFPTSAALLQRMWAASGAAPVDGIMVIDPVAAVELLELVGPVNVGGTNVTAANGLKLFLHDQYVQFQTNRTLERRDFMADVVQAIFIKLDSGSFDSRELGKALGDAAAGRHLLAWTPTKNVQQGWNALGMDGALPDHSVTFALQNRGGNKLDYFQKVSATTRATVSRAGSKIEIDFLITNATPSGEPTYIAGPVPGSAVNQPGYYVGIASVNIPKAATGVKLIGGDYDMAEGPDGNTQVKSTFLVLQPGKTAKLHLEFSLPPEIRALTIVPSARVPSVLWHTSKLVWNDTKPQVITW